MTTAESIQLALRGAKIAQTALARLDYARDPFLVQRIVSEVQREVSDLQTFVAGVHATLGASSSTGGPTR